MVGCVDGEPERVGGFHTGGVTAVPEGAADAVAVTLGAGSEIVALGTAVPGKVGTLAVFLTGSWLVSTVDAGAAASLGGVDRKMSPAVTAAVRIQAPMIAAG